MAKNQPKAPVTERALIQRTNRKLAKDDERLVKVRENALTGNGVPLVHDLGHFYVVDLNRNAIVRTHVDLEALGRELDVLQPWERLES